MARNTKSSDRILAFGAKYTSAEHTAIQTAHNNKDWKGLKTALNKPKLSTASAIGQAKWSKAYTNIILAGNKYEVKTIKTKFNVKLDQKPQTITHRMDDIAKAKAKSKIKTPPPTPKPIGPIGRKGKLPQKHRQAPPSVNIPPVPAPVMYKFFQFPFLVAVGFQELQKKRYYQVIAQSPIWSTFNEFEQTLSLSKGELHLLHQSQIYNMRVFLKLGTNKGDRIISTPVLGLNSRTSIKAFISQYQPQKMIKNSIGYKYYEDEADHSTFAKVNSVKALWANYYLGPKP